MVGNSKENQNPNLNRQNAESAAAASNTPTSASSTNILCDCSNNHKRPCIATLVSALVDSTDFDAIKQTVKMLAVYSIKYAKEIVQHRGHCAIVTCLQQHSGADRAFVSYSLAVLATIADTVKEWPVDANPVLAQAQARHSNSNVIARRVCRVLARTPPTVESMTVLNNILDRFAKERVVVELCAEALMQTHVQQHNSYDRGRNLTQRKLAIGQQLEQAHQRFPYSAMIYKAMILFASEKGGNHGGVLN